MATSGTKDKLGVRAAKRRPGKLYESRRAESGLAGAPIRPQKRPVRQFQLALLAASMAKADSDFRAGELVDRALRLWHAAGSALLVEEQAAVLTTGILVLNRQDWVLHCGALITSLNDSEGAQPGRGNPAGQRTAYEDAQQTASDAVCRAWMAGPDRDELLKALFRGQSETADSRHAKFVALCGFAKATLERGDTQPLTGKTGDPLSVEILHAWEPLVPRNGTIPPRALSQARMVVDGSAATVHALLPLDPMVARWLVVLRQAQVSESKVRS